MIDWNDKLNSISNKLISLKNQTMLGLTENDSDMFSKSDSLDLEEIKMDLASNSDLKKKNGMKKIIVAMTQGKDMTALFPPVLKCVQTQSLELKKLIHLYFTSFKQTKPDMVILAMNTIRKDCIDANPIIRALAIRTMGSICDNSCCEYITEIMNKLFDDEDPYVRKCFVLSTLKIFKWIKDKDEKTAILNILKKMLEKESNSFVLANLVYVLSAIDSDGFIPLELELIKKLIMSLPECTEWGQIMILDMLCKYLNPSESQKDDELLKKLVSRLTHSNPGVVLSASNLIIKIIISIKDSKRKQDLIEYYVIQRILNALSSFVSIEPNEKAYAIIKSVKILLLFLKNNYKPRFEFDYSVFFIRINDSTYLIKAKIEILYIISVEHCPNNSRLLNFRPVKELIEYSHCSNIEKVKSSIKALAKICIKWGFAEDEPAHELWLYLLNYLANNEGNLARNELMINVVDLCYVQSNIIDKSVIQKIVNTKILFFENKEQALSRQISLISDKIDYLTANEIEIYFDEILQNYENHGFLTKYHILELAAVIYSKFKLNNARDHILKISKDSSEFDLATKAQYFYFLIENSPKNLNHLFSQFGIKYKDLTIDIDKDYLNEFYISLGNISTVYEIPKKQLS